MEEPKKSFGLRSSMIVLMVSLGSGTLGCASSTAAGRLRGEAIASPRVLTAQQMFETALRSESDAGESVTIYGVEWCGPCHQAAAFLSKRGVQYVERNIEGDEDAQREMQTKLQRAGLRAGSIPIIDVKGNILVGFSPQAVDRALQGPQRR